MNSVCCLKVLKGKYNFKRPYSSFDEVESSGSGFLIEGGKGYVVTAAHVVADAISIIGRFIKSGKKDLNLEIVGICREKDLALLKICSSDLSLLPDPIPLKFGDSMLIKPGDKVKAIGFPLGTSSVKISEGIVSGFESVEDNREDSITRCPAYIQITAPINPGNSGGPLLNAENEVIGITVSGKDRSQNISFAVPSRTFIAIYKELKKGGKVNMPTLSLDWCKTNREIMKKQTGSASTYGIYVRRIYPDSCCDILEKGDIIRRIDYVDTMWTTNGATNKETFALREVKDKEEVLVTVFLDRFGMSTNIGRLKNPAEADETKIEFEKIFTDRKMEIPEIMDMIPIGTDIMLNICRIAECGPSWYMLKTKYIMTPNYRVPSIYPTLNCRNSKPIDYEIFGGMCVTNLSLEAMNAFDIERDMSNQFEKRLIIVQVFPATLAYKTDSVREGMLIKSVYAYDKDMVLLKETHKHIESLDTLRDILKLKPDFLQVNCSDDSTFLFSPSPEEDEYIKKTYKILD